jgi:hypothetical protein
MTEKSKNYREERAAPTENRTNKNLYILNQREEKSKSSPG